MDEKEKKKEIANRKKMARLAANDKLSRLEKIEEEQKANKLNEPFQAFEQFEGPVKKRKATDKWWMIGIFLCLVYFFVHGIWVIMGGKTYRLYSGLDFRAKPCGMDNLGRKKFLHWPIANINSNITMCIDACPEDTGRRLCLYHPDGVTKHVGDAFCYTSIQTTYDGRYCIPREPKTKITIDAWVYSWENVYRRAIGDLSLTYDVIICSFILMLIVMVVTLFLLSFTKTLTCCIWVSIILCINALNLMALFCYIEYAKTIKRRCFNGKDENYCGGARARLFWLLIFVFFGVGMVFLIAVLYFCRKFAIIIKSMRDSIFIWKRLRQNKLNIAFGKLNVIQRFYSDYFCDLLLPRTDGLCSQLWTR